MNTPISKTYRHTICPGVFAAYILDESILQDHWDSYRYIYDEIGIDEHNLDFEQYSGTSLREISYIEAFKDSRVAGEYKLRKNCKMYTGTDGSYRFMTSCPTGEEIRQLAANKYARDAVEYIYINKKTGIASSYTRR